jgi:hypothetical protein
MKGLDRVLRLQSPGLRSFFRELVLLHPELIFSFPLRFAGSPEAVAGLRAESWMV